MNNDKKVRKPTLTLEQNTDTEAQKPNPAKDQMKNYTAIINTRFDAPGRYKRAVHQCCAKLETSTPHYEKYHEN